MTRTLYALGPFAAALLFAVSALPAQTTWIVDAQNGPGAHFVDLPPAVAASAPGDVILLRRDPQGSAYRGTTITHALTIVGVGGKARMQDNLLLLALPAGQDVVLRDLEMAPFVGAATTTFSRIYATACVGSVHLQGVEFDPGQMLLSSSQWLFQDCRFVSLTDCRFSPHHLYQALAFRDCELVTATRCTFRNFASSTGVMLERSRVVSIDSAWHGVIGPFALHLIALWLEDSVLELAGDSLLVGAPNQAILWTGNSQVLLGPSATVPQLAGPTAAATIDAMGAYIDAASNIEIELHGAANGITVLSFGNPLDNSVPLWGADYFLDAPTVSVFDFVVLDQAGAGRWQALLPAGLVPAGVSLWLQAATIDPLGAFRLTTPAVITTP